MEDQIDIELIEPGQPEGVQPETDDITPDQAAASLAFSTNLMESLTPQAPQAPQEGQQGQAEQEAEQPQEDTSEDLQIIKEDIAALREEIHQALEEDGTEE